MSWVACGVLRLKRGGVLAADPIEGPAGRAARVVIQDLGGRPAPRRSWPQK